MSTRKFLVREEVEYVFDVDEDDLLQPDGREVDDVNDRVDELFCDLENPNRLPLTVVERSVEEVTGL